MVPNKVRLKFKNTLPIRLQHQLTTVHGFSFFARLTGEWIIYEKELKPPRIVATDLPDDVVAELSRKVNAIANSFQDPDAHKNVIKMRCTNLSRTLLPKQRQWVLDWVRRVIDEDDTESDPPWDDNIDVARFTPERGAC